MLKVDVIGKKQVNVMNEFAPIVVFCNRRLDTLKITISSLQANFLSNESDLYIYSDGWNDHKSKFDVERVRIYIKEIHGFKTVNVIESTSKKGCANSIISGISEVINKYGKCIVVEDDLLISPNFLCFMNQSLNEYKSIERVFSISGYSFDLEHLNFHNDTYFLNRPWPWGWATWADRWNTVDWEMPEYYNFKFDSIEKKKFSQLGSDVNLMLKRQMNKKIDAWCIRFTFYHFLKGGLTLYPKVSKVNNMGFDHYATHTVGIKDRYETKTDTSNQSKFIYPEKVEIDKFYQNQFLSKFSYWSRIINKLKELVLMKL